MLAYLHNIIMQNFKIENKFGLDQISYYLFQNKTFPKNFNENKIILKIFDQFKI